MKRNRYSIVVEESYKAALESLAIKYGKKYGMKPNVSAFICAIADGEIPLSGGVELTLPQVQAMMRAVNTLVTRSDKADAQMLCEFLLGSNSVNDMVKEQIQRIRSQQLGWVQEVESYISSFQPFALCTENGNVYQCEYAEFKNPDVGEGRRYLVAWINNVHCDPESDEIPELAHNRTFRTDRDLLVYPLSSHTWKHEGLDTIEVCLHLMPGFRYNPKVEDVSVELVEDWRGERRIEVRKNIYSLFWFFQTLQRYGNSAYIISPQGVIDTYLLRLGRILTLYKEHYQ